MPTQDYLKRLGPENYRGFAWVHWTMTMNQRQVGWLSDGFHWQFRERLTHVAFRYQIACPIYCSMPDHIHQLWAGLAETSDQRNAMKSFRKEVNRILETINASVAEVTKTSHSDDTVAEVTKTSHSDDTVAEVAETSRSGKPKREVSTASPTYRLQPQAYDHFLREHEREREAIEDVVEYIARNPERKGLVAVDGFAEYPFTGCLLPGFPSVELFQEASWDTIWRTISFLKRTEVFRRSDPKRT